MGSFRFMTLTDGHEVHLVSHFPKCEFKLIYHCRCHEIIQLELHPFMTPLNAQCCAVLEKYGVTELSKTSFVLSRDLLKSNP